MELDAVGELGVAELDQIRLAGDLVSAFIASRESVGKQPSRPASGRPSARAANPCAAFGARVCEVGRGGALLQGNVGGCHSYCVFWLMLCWWFLVGSS